MVSGQIMPSAMCRICNIPADGWDGRGEVFRFVNMTQGLCEDDFFLCAKCAADLRDWVHARRDERLAKGPSAEEKAFTKEANR